ncbi:MAG TPA: hypothetical protein VN026_10880 [Bacteroidia bacterium]|jgi:hypothetical protein|nr:hypothetical protein [Bacteroidia bacterium]
MNRLIQCGYCGRICKLTRSDKSCCSNTCAVKLIYAKKHNYETPLESYLRLINGVGLDSLEPDILEQEIKIKQEPEKIRIGNNNMTEIDEKLKKYSKKNLNQLENG